MSTSFIGEVSIIEVCGNVYGIKFMLEDFLKKIKREIPQCGGLGVRH
jgi:hypothetical protein